MIGIVAMVAPVGVAIAIVAIVIHAIREATKICRPRSVKREIAIKRPPPTIAAAIVNAALVVADEMMRVRETTRAVGMTLAIATIRVAAANAIAHPLLRRRPVLRPPCPPPQRPRPWRQAVPQ